MANPNPKGNKGKGRKKGVPNKNTKLLKDMILNALDKAGGEEYLIKQSEKEPRAFLTLIGKVLPTQITGPSDGALVIKLDKKSSKI